MARQPRPPRGGRGGNVNLAPCDHDECGKLKCTMTTTEKLERIKAKCREIIALGEKRTQGRWEWETIQATSEAIQVSTLSAGRVLVRHWEKEQPADASFIAACAGPAEAMAKSTIAAIEAMEDMSEHMEAMLTANILSAWPDELLL